MPVARPARILLRLFVSIAVACVAIVALFFGYAGYVVARHDTVNLPPNHGNVQDELFLGSGTQQPLIVGLGGSEGGNAWASDFWKPQRDKFIAGGYAMLTIGYFGREGLPEKLDRIALEGVHDAIARAAANPQVDGRCIVVIGGSKGGELALALAAHYPDIKAVVGIVAANAVFASLTEAMTSSSFSWQGRPLPFVPVPWSTTPALLAGDLRRAFEIMIEDREAVANAAIPVERINGPVLLVSATHDEFWPSKEMSDAIMQRLDANGFEYAHQHIAIDGGHTAPLQHFDRIEAFLDAQLKADQATGCARAR